MHEDDFAPRVNFAREKKNKNKQKKTKKLFNSKKKILTEGKG